MALARSPDETSASMKMEEPDDEDTSSETAPLDQHESMETTGNTDQSTIAHSDGDGVAESKVNANSASYIPAALHEFYRHASSINNKGDFICALCSKLLKCRSARDMRDHALSHGGAHWASAFRCLLCSYHSHSRRSVSKHVTSAHLIPDGVQCQPGELMENETISRQDELMALVRDCFPLSSLLGLGYTNSNGEHQQTINGAGTAGAPMALPVETGQKQVNREKYGRQVAKKKGGLGPMRVRISEGGEYVFDDGGAGGNWPDHVGNGDEQGSSAEAAGVVEGWTVVEDGDGSDTDDTNAAFSHFQTDSTPAQSTAIIRTPVLQGLLRDFQFQSNPYAHEPARFRTAPSTMRESSASGSNDDPRALIERLLNVVAPDVARFLLEEAIRAREVTSNGHCSMMPNVSMVSASAGSTFGQMTQRNPAKTVNLNIKKTSTVAQPTSSNRLKAEHRLGKLGVFKCNECNALFKRKRYLERHVRARHKLQCYRCTMHGCPFTNARELWYVRRHYAKHHSDGTDLICRFCSQLFPSADEMANRHHPCCSLTPRKPADSPSKE